MNNEAAFKKWYKHNQTVALTFTEEDVYREQPDAAKNGYPDVWKQGNITLPLSYHFEPNAEDDGVTVNIPLPVLNQVSDVGFDWQVPGLRHDRVVALIKSLPKRLRKNFVPAPNFAQACLADISPQDKNGRPVGLLEALSAKLRKMTGVEVLPDDWNLPQVDTHLTMHFAVVSEKGQVIAQGDNLESLKQQCQGKVQKTFEKAATPELERKGLQSWDFDNLPDTFVQKVGGFEVQAYPALVRQGAKADIVLVDDEDRARELHEDGVNALLRAAIPSPVGHLEKTLPNKAKLGLYFNPFGQIKALVDDCIFAGIDSLRAAFEQQHNTVIRSQTVFEQCADWVRGEINDKVVEIAQQVEIGLTLAHQCQKQMKGNIPLTMVGAMGDIRQHLGSLVYPGFVTDIGAARLADWNRYIKALVRRLEKLPIDPTKDRQAQLTIEKVTAEYEQTCKKYPSGKAPETLREGRWMIEELRVSLFAQQLGTAYPVSAKRIQNFLADF